MKKNDVFLILKPKDYQAEEEIYTRLIQNSALKKHGQKPGRFHVTLCLINQVDSAHQVELKSSLQKSIEFLKSIDVTFERLDRYMVGQDQRTNKRTFDNCSLVIYPTVKDGLALKEINRTLFECLGRFNEENGTKYSFISDTLPENFQPHLTLATTTDVNDRIAEDASVHRCSLIQSLTPIFQQMDKSFKFIVH